MIYKVLGDGFMTHRILEDSVIIQRMSKVEVILAHQVLEESVIAHPLGGLRQVSPIMGDRCHASTNAGSQDQDTKRSEVVRALQNAPLFKRGVVKPENYFLQVF